MIPPMSFAAAKDNRDIIEDLFYKHRMLKVKCFLADSVWVLEDQVNRFLQGGEITGANQIVNFYTSAFGTLTKPQAFFATILYNSTQKALSADGEEQKALPGEQRALPETI